MATQAIITMENGGRIVLELDPSQAPQTVANFKALADRHFYDGLIFHRVIRGFMIQGGCPQGTGTGGPGYQIKGEFRANGVNNRIRHERGVISMARATDPDSAGSQFFIMHQAAPHLDGQYAAFGKVSEGLDVVDRIAAAKTGRQDCPLEEQKIRSLVVEETGSQADGQAGTAAK
jgi:peptidyl-prolyl cis-trans isomerase B (cyclophilin B)